MKRQKLRVFMMAASLAVLAIFSACNEDDEMTIAPPEAEYSFVQNGAVITFTNTSTGEDNTYSWNFGDGTSSTLASPTKEYTTAGTFSVVLTATNEGGEDDFSQDIVITEASVDVEAPVITLIGDAAISIEIGSEYMDEGATANDNVDGTITDNIVVTGEVDPLVPGEYTIAYNVSDAAGNEATEVTRVVTVTFDDGLLTNGDFETGDGTGWIGNALQVRTEGENSFNFADVEMAGDAFNVNLSQVVPMALGNKYMLSFNASTGAESGRTILAGIGLNEDPWTNVTIETTITTTVQRFEYEILANFGSANSRVIFDMGADVGNVVIDNVSLELISENVSELPLDFENSEEVVVPFNGAAFDFDEDPEDANNKVGKITNAGGTPNNFEGVSILLGSAVDLTTDNLIKMRFNTSVANIPVLMKFENGGAPIEVSAMATTTGWQELSFDFSAASASYSQIVIFVDGPGTTGGDFFIDDISQEAGSGGNGGGGTGGCTTGLVAAMDIPVDFEGCETFLSGQNFGEGISSEIVVNPSKDGVNGSDYVLKVDKAVGANRFAGIQNVFPNALDFTDDVLKLKIYSSKANTTFRFELILSPNPDGLGNPAPQFVTVDNANEWTEVEVEFSGFPVSADAYNQLVIKPDNPNGTDGEMTMSAETYYIDDITTGPATVTGDESEFCERTIMGRNSEPGSDAIVSIYKVNSNTMVVEIESADSDPIDALVLPAGAWTPSTAGLNPGMNDAGVYSQEFFFPDGAPENIEGFFFEWSKESFGGNWASTVITLPFDSNCTD